MSDRRTIISMIGRFEPWPLTIRMRLNPCRASEEQTQTPYLTRMSHSMSMVPGQSM